MSVHDQPLPALWIRKSMKVRILATHKATVIKALTFRSIRMVPTHVDVAISEQ